MDRPPPKVKGVVVPGPNPKWNPVPWGKQSMVQVRVMLDAYTVSSSSYGVQVKLHYKDRITIVTQELHDDTGESGGFDRSIFAPIEVDMDGAYDAPPAAADEAASSEDAFAPGPELGAVGVKRKAEGVPTDEEIAATFADV